MAVGKSNRVVIELPAGIKQRLYPVLRSRGITVRDWFLANAEKEFGDEKKPRKRPFHSKKDRL